MELDLSTRIVFENESYLLLNKPAGIPVQTADDQQASLVTLAKAAFGREFLLTHRLDQPTSGLVVLAKTAAAQRHFHQQLQERKVKKNYLAVVKKGMENPIDVVEHWVRKRRDGNIAEVVTPSSPGAKLARLQYRTVQESDLYALLEVSLQTGRFHQIRVQLAALGFPVKGDVKYGFRRGNRDRSIHLHSAQIEFKGLNDQIVVQAPMPTEDPLWRLFAELVKNEN